MHKTNMLIPCSIACFTCLPFYFSGCIADRDFTPGVSVFKNIVGAIHSSLRRESKEWLARNQDDVIEWGDMSMVAVSFIAGGNRRTRRKPPTCRK
jgi:hypothetical protein